MAYREAGRNVKIGHQRHSQSGNDDSRQGGGRNKAASLSKYQKEKGATSRFSIDDDSNFSWPTNSNTKSPRFDDYRSYKDSQWSPISQGSTRAPDSSPYQQMTRSLSPSRRAGEEIQGTAGFGRGWKPGMPAAHLPNKVPWSHDGEGKWVRFDENGIADSRGGCSLKGGILKDNAQDEILPDAHAEKERMLDLEKREHKLRFCGFTDRAIRWQDGDAMREIWKSYPTSKPDCGPSCQCPSCKPMKTSLLPPAGQVSQIEVGNAGMPPYMLQVQSDGRYPVPPGAAQDPWHGKMRGAVRSSTLHGGYGQGRHHYLQQRLPEYKEAEQEELRRQGKDMIGRGCEPPPPVAPGSNPRANLSAGVTACFVSGAFEENEAKAVLRKEMGNKQIPDEKEKPGAKAKETLPFYWDDSVQNCATDELCHYRKKVPTARGAKVTVDKLMYKNAEPPASKEADRKLLRNRGAFKAGTISDHTMQRMMQESKNVYRYEPAMTCRLGGAGCHSLGDPDLGSPELDDLHSAVDFAGKDRSPRVNDEEYRGSAMAECLSPRSPSTSPRPTRALSRWASMPPPKLETEDSGCGNSLVMRESHQWEERMASPRTPRSLVDDSTFAGKPSRSPHPGTGRKPLNGQPSNNIVRSLDTIDAWAGRERRLRTEPAFARQCQNTTRIFETHSRVSNDLVNLRGHHLQSSSVKDLLQMQ
eukprot:TRINITY_DN113261_c0_g1_i1.p1 TRINITY_DN113261_c0_g1~~TRINITY_DN113261_c0_g1_i1.p1  ORF type:complete len:697 (+),score=139.70 TRINITY_DN113261_c0_g1_i1:197-2287(+)